MQWLGALMTHDIGGGRRLSHDNISHGLRKLRHKSTDPEKCKPHTAHAIREWMTLEDW